MIWLIGCKGLLGSEVSRQLKDTDLTFIETDKEVDITDLSILQSFAYKQKNKITHIINCAGYTNVDKAETEVDICTKLNVQGPYNIAKVAKEINATMIHISTDYVFDGSSSSPYTEEDTPNPLSIYGKTKADSEKMIHEELSKYYILRTSWLYGFNGKNFVYTMLKAMNTHNTIKVVNDQKGTPTFAGTLAYVIIQLIKKELSNSSIPYGIYNCTDLGETTWFEYAKEIYRQAQELGLITNYKCAINPCTTDEYSAIASRPSYSVLSKNKLSSYFQLNNWKVQLNDFLENY